MSDDGQRIIGYGPAGRTYPHAIVVEAQQPSPHGIDLQFIIDDGMLTDFIRYVAADQRRRMVKLQTFDQDRALRFADLSLPPGTSEVIIECFNAGNHRIPDLCCTYNLYSCAFAPYEVAVERLDEGKKAEKGVTLTYSKSGGYADYETAKKLARQADKGFFSGLTVTIFDFFLLAARCYLGALIAYHLGYTKPDTCIVAALIAGLLSERTLGDTVRVLAQSKVTWACLIFTPVLGAAYLAIRRDVVQQLIYGGGVMEELSYKLDTIEFGHKSILYAVKWSMVILVALWFIVWIFSPEKSDEEEGG